MSNEIKEPSSKTPLILGAIIFLLIVATSLYIHLGKVGASVPKDAKEAHYTEKTYYPDGKIEIIQGYVDGVDSDSLVYYHPNGKVRLRKVYATTNSKPGILKKFNKHGDLIYTCPIDKHGERHGECKRYRDSVHITSAYYINGRQNGHLEVYYKSGSVSSRHKGKDYILEGPAKFFREDGSLISTITYKAGKGHGFEHVYQRDSSLYMKTKYVEGKLLRQDIYDKRGLIINSEYYDSEGLCVVERIIGGKLEVFYRGIPKSGGYCLTEKVSSYGVDDE